MIGNKIPILREKLKIFVGVVNKMFTHSLPLPTV